MPCRAPGTLARAPRGHGRPSNGGRGWSGGGGRRGPRGAKRGQNGRGFGGGSLDAFRAPYRNRLATTPASSLFPDSAFPLLAPATLSHRLALARLRLSPALASLSLPSVAWPSTHKKGPTLTSGASFAACACARPSRVSLHALLSRHCRRRTKEHHPHAD
jgi:hypothetical protein